MKRIVFNVIVLCICIGLGVTGALADEYTFGDLGKPPDYDQTIKRFTGKDADFDGLPEQALPAAFDWRDYGMVTVPKDQASCGSCWAFASAGAFESKILIMGGPSYDLSEQQEISCNTAQLGCSGGWAEALRFWETKGPMLESCTGYPSSGGTEPACSTLAGCSELPYRTINYYTVNMTTTEIKNSVYNHGPGYFRFDVHRDFYNPSSPYNGFWQTASAGSVYTNATSDKIGGHAVLIIGWSDSKNAWLLKNSWGATGGPDSDGTFWMAYTGHATDLNFGMGNTEISYAGAKILHRDGAIYNSGTGWTATTPPYFAGTSYAADMETRDDGTYTVLHKDGALWDSNTGWTMTTPPYYAGTSYARDLEYTGTLVLDEDFEGSFPPSGWTVVDNESSGGVWQLNTYWGNANWSNYGDNGTCADADSDAFGWFDMDTELRSPSFSLSSCSSAELRFNIGFYGYSGGESANVDISTNGGSSWANLVSYSGASMIVRGPITLDLSSYCGYGNVMVRFHYANAWWDYWFMVDDVQVIADPSTTILHRDGALWNTVNGWTFTTPPYYAGTAYAKDLEYDTTYYAILHRDGAVWRSDTGWNMSTPPYYVGTSYARDLEFMNEGGDFTILHKDGCIYDSVTGWYMDKPPYYSGSDYTRDLEVSN